MEGGGWYDFAAPLPDAHPRLVGTLLLRPLQEPVTPTPDLNVVAVGYPRGGTEGQTITIGEVVAADAHSTQYDFIAHSAPLNPGNSGGPLFSMPEAKLLGVNTARSLQTLTFYAVPYQLIAEPMKEWRSKLVTRPVPTPEPDSSFDPVQVMGSLYTVNRVVDPASGRPQRVCDWCRST